MPVADSVFIKYSELVYIFYSTANRVKLLLKGVKIIKKRVMIVAPSLIYYFCIGTKIQPKTFVVIDSVLLTLFSSTNKFYNEYLCSNSCDKQKKNTKK